MTQPIRLAKVSDRPRRIGDWAETQTARDITRSLEMVTAIDGPGFTMIAGGPGTGKTTAVRRFCEARGHDALYVQAARDEGTVSNTAHALARLFGDAVPHFKTLADARFILAQQIGRNRLLVVDEAQYLNQRHTKTGQIGAAFEWLRAMADEGRFHLVFCGDLHLPRAIEAMPQLQSRMMRPVIIGRVSRADVAAVVAGTRVDRAQFIEVLHGVAQLKGGLRNVANVAQLAQLFAGEGEVTLAHLKAAIIDLKLGKGSNTNGTA